MVELRNSGPSLTCLVSCDSLVPSVLTGECRNSARNKCARFVVSAAHSSGALPSKKPRQIPNNSTAPLSLTEQKYPVSQLAFTSTRAHNNLFRSCAYY